MQRKLILKAILVFSCICVFANSQDILNSNVDECPDECEVPKEERLKICSTLNTTYDSECHFIHAKCLCYKNDPLCTNKKVLNDTLDYYGPCQDVDNCSNEQLELFPNRIKKWFDEVLFVFNDRKELDLTKYGNLISLANQMKKDKVEKYWTCGVAFEFCQLDKSNDGIIESNELKELIAPLKALEHCIQPFLNDCDKDKNGQILDAEWVQCLDLSEDDLVLLRRVCNTKAIN